MNGSEAERVDEPDGVVLRDGRPEDGVAVAGVFGAARAEMRYLPVLHSHEEHVVFFSTRVLPTSRVTVADVAGEVVAFSAVKDGWLDHLYVAPAHQRRGIGRALLGRAMPREPGRVVAVGLRGQPPRHRLLRGGRVRRAAPDRRECERRA